MAAININMSSEDSARLLDALAKRYDKLLHIVQYLEGNYLFPTAAAADKDMLDNEANTYLINASKTVAADIDAMADHITEVLNSTSASVANLEQSVHELLLRLKTFRELNTIHGLRALQISQDSREAELVLDEKPTGIPNPLFLTCRVEREPISARLRVLDGIGIASSAGGNTMKKSESVGGSFVNLSSPSAIDNASNLGSRTEGLSSHQQGACAHMSTADVTAVKGGAGIVGSARSSLLHPSRRLSTAAGLEANNVDISKPPTL